MTSIGSLLVPVIAFGMVTLCLTFNVLGDSGLIIGDNMYWNESTVSDVLGPRIVRESFMGDIAVLSTFKTGFLFPLAWILNSLKIPMTVIYPFLFYFLSMLSFYSFSAEFLKKTPYRIILSAIYVVNPVVPYYFTSMMSAFTIAFLPLSLKFLIKALKGIDEKPHSKLVSPNLAVSAFFLAIAISAHEQFLPTAFIVAVFSILMFGIFCYRRQRFTKTFLKNLGTNTSLFLIIIALVNIPLILSLQNITKAPLSTYFTGRFSDFMENVKYTYSTANLTNLLRYGGDSGVGLAQNSWFDSSALTNLFGYGLFIVLLLSVFFLISDKKVPVVLKYFTYMAIMMYGSTIVLILFLQYLPSNTVLAGNLFSLPLQTWESPAKLRVLLLLSGLATCIIAFRKLEEFDQTKKQKFFSGVLLTLLVSSVVIYNSPWAVNYFGYTPLQQISESKNWGDLYDKQYARLADVIHNNYSNERGIIIPYTHKTALYLPPNFRLFQLISPVNGELAQFTQHSTISWSKLLGLLSIRHVILDYGEKNPNEMLLFPIPGDDEYYVNLEEIRNDTALVLQDENDNCTFLDNQNALPEVYATQYYILYDDPSTLKYAFDSINFNKLPAFIGPSKQVNQISVPEFTNQATYEIKALYPQNTSKPQMPLEVVSGNETSFLLLNREGNSSHFAEYSTTYNLESGDVVKVPGAKNWEPAKEIPELTLNSSTQYLGDYFSFILNFTVSILQRGEYSFLGPRVVIDVGNLTKYFLVFHDTGTVELAAVHNGVFRSNMLVQHTAYDLRNAENSVNVSITRVFDEIQVWVNNQLALSFATDPSISTVFLSSEHSTSKFTNIELKTQEIVRLYASRNFSSQLEFVVTQKGPENCVLEVNTPDSDYAVVVQYLNTPLRRIVTPSSANPVTANIFFSGWILKPENSTSKLELVKIEIANSTLILGLTSFSIAATWLILIEVAVGSRRIYSRLSSLSAKLKHTDNKELL